MPSCRHAFSAVLAISMAAAVIAPRDAHGEQILYAVGNPDGDGSSSLYHIADYATNPTAVAIGETNRDIADIAFDSTAATLYGVRWGSPKLYEIDPVTGQSAWNGPTAPPNEQTALECAADGALYSWGCTQELFRIDKTTGAKTLIGDTGFRACGDLAFDRDGTLYGLAHEGEGTVVDLIKIDLSTGAGTLIGSLGFHRAGSLEIDCDGTMYVGREEDSGAATLYTVDKATAQPTLIGTVTGAETLGIWGIAFTVAAIPEPSTAVLLATAGIVLLFGCGRNRRVRRIAD